jgi:hypothetical protein
MKRAGIIFLSILKVFFTGVRNMSIRITVTDNLKIPSVNVLAETNLMHEGTAAIKSRERAASAPIAILPS